MSTPQLWIVAGPNGAGKTTCVQAEPISALLPKVRFLNPDETTKQLLLAQGYRGFADVPQPVLLQSFGQAATQVETELVAAIRRGESIGIETVLSTDKYRKVVQEVRSLGGTVNLLFVTVAAPAIAVARVAVRVSRGGHGVPPRKITDRFYRSHLNLNWFASHVNDFWVIDNSGSDPSAPPTIPAYGSDGRLDHLDPNASDMLKCVLSTLPRSTGESA